MSKLGYVEFGRLGNYFGWGMAMGHLSYVLNNTYMLSLWICLEGQLSGKVHTG